MKKMFLLAMSLVALLVLAPAFADKKDRDERKEAMMQIKEERQERLEKAREYRKERFKGECNVDDDRDDDDRDDDDRDDDNN